MEGVSVEGVSGKGVSVKGFCEGVSVKGCLCKRGQRPPSPFPRWPLKWAVCICILVRDNFHILVFLPTKVSYRSSIV